MANRRFTQFFYTLHNYPVLLDCNFVVAPTDPAGVSSLKGPGIDDVFMNSSASFSGDTHTSVLVDDISDTSGLEVGMPVQGSGIPVGAKIASIVDANSITLTAATSTSVGDGTITYQAVGSPEPIAGYIYVKLSDNYERFYGFDWDISVPVAGASINVNDGSVLTRGVPYQIVTLGTTTAAQWAVLGVPVGVTAAVGLVFMAAITGVGGGTGTVKALGTPGINEIVLAGDPNYSLKNSGPGAGYLIFKCLAASGSDAAPTFTGTPHTITGTVAAPTFTGESYTPAGTVETHTHSIPAGTDSAGGTSGTTAPAFTGSAHTLAGTNSAPAFTGESYTPAGTISAPAFTPVAALTAPTTSSIVRLSMYFSNSRIKQGNE